MSAASSVARPDFPPAYAPFAPVLDRLSVSLVELLHGQLLQFERLSRAVDPHELAPHGEFEGLGGLTMRGEITQIVQSELLLRTEAPLEFLRRLAESEMLYLEKQFADPGTRPVYRAMVSVGPGLLGHGRLVALAALFFLARIAHAKGAAFHWCFLPREQGAVWFDALSVNTVKRFLRAASYREMNRDDTEAAQRVWEGLAPDAAGAAPADYLDWVIAAAPRRDTPIVMQTAGTLTFALQPSVPGERRAALCEIRRRSGERARATILFPDDRVCVSALDNPFAPIRPAALAAAPAGPRPKMAGWEPLYFLAPRTDTRIIRMPHGLLVLRGDASWKATESWFVLLPAHVVLAGVTLEGNCLHLAVHTARSGRDTMVRKAIRLLGPGKSAVYLEVHREVPSAHLFRNQRRWALPTMSWGGEVEVYSTFGQAFAFEPRPEGGPTQFATLHKAPRTLLATGSYRVVQDKGEKSAIRILKEAQRQHDRFFTGTDVIHADRLFGMVYSPSHRSLAYSVLPDVWTVPTRQYAGEAGTIRLEPHETLLTAYGSPERLTARIWSDARQGGNGTVRTMRYDNGVPTLKQPVLKLGADAASIVKIQPGDDGIWAMKVDDEQVPSELLLYRKKKHGQLECTRFDLDALARGAIKIDLGALHD